MRVSRQKRRKNGFISFVMGVAALGAVAGLSFGIAWAWQGMQEKSPDPAVNLAQAAVLQSEPETVPDAPGIESLYVSPETPSPLPENVDTPGDGFRVRPEYSYALPETKEKADKRYFDDALFIGDSISVGIPLYGIMDNAAVIAFQGINTVNINTKAAVDLKGDGNRVTMLEAATQSYPDKTKIYIMLGGNGLDYDEKTFIDGYRDFIASVKKAYPKAKVFIQTILPVTESAYLTYPSVSNEKIDRYNLLIMELAREQNVFFVDVAAALMDDTGKLPTEASPSDGMHIGAEYYHKWFDYLRAHTAETIS